MTALLSWIALKSLKYERRNLRPQDLQHSWELPADIRILSGSDAAQRKQHILVFVNTDSVQCVRGGTPRTEYWTADIVPSGLVTFSGNPGVAPRPPG